MEAEVYHEILGINFSNADLISMGLLIVTIIMVYHASASNRFNARSSDIDNYLRMYDRLQEIWDCYNPNTQSQQEQEDALDKIINNYEIVCHLHNIRFFRGASREMLNSFLKETVSKMVTSNPVVIYMNNSASSNSTYREIELFCVINRIENNMGWRFSPFRIIFVYIYFFLRRYKYMLPFIN